MKTIHTVVFQACEGGGNPCPVTLNADGLSAEEMQKMTKEFGHESAFLMKPTRTDCDIKARYFVPLHEMEMCTHATVASVTVLVKKGIVRHSPVRFETFLGPIPVDWEWDNGEVIVGVHQFLPKTLEESPTREELCAALRIESGDLAEDAPKSVSTSRFKLLVPLKSRAVLDELHPDFDLLWNLCDQYHTTGFYPFYRESKNENAVCYARQFPKRAGYNEDPATGVAASALGAYLVLGRMIDCADGWNRITVYQGFSMGMPSVIYSEIKMEKGVVTDTKISGKAEVIGDL